MNCAKLYSFGTELNLCNNKIFFRLGIVFGGAKLNEHNRTKNPVPNESEKNFLALLIAHCLVGRDPHKCIPILSESLL